MVLIPSTAQSGQKLKNAVAKAMPAITNAPILRPVPTGAKIPAIRRMVPAMILIFLSVLPTLAVISIPPCMVLDTHKNILLKEYHKKDVSQSILLTLQALSDFLLRYCHAIAYYICIGNHERIYRRRE